MEPESSSDDEELFSYLEQVQEVRLANEVDYNINKEVEGDVSNKASLESEITVENNNDSELRPFRKLGDHFDEIKRISEEKEKIQCKVKIINHQPICSNSDVIHGIETAGNEAREQNNLDWVPPSQNDHEKTFNEEHDKVEIQASETGRNQTLTKSIIELPAESVKRKLKQKVKNRKDLSTVHSKVDICAAGRSNAESSMQQNYEKIVAVENDIQQQPEISGCGQTPDNSSGTDKYYLINEKDWLSLCAKLTDNHDTTEDDHHDVQDNETSPLKDSKSVSMKYGSMFNAVRQYSPLSKASLKKNVLTHSSNKDEHHQEVNNLKVNTDTKSTSSSRQNLSPCHSELKSPSKNMPNKTIPGTPKVEIVYIRLEDGQVNEDGSKSITPLSDNSKDKAVKKLDFFENKTADENKKSRENIETKEEYVVDCNRQNPALKRCIGRTSDLTEAVPVANLNEHEPFVPYPDTVNKPGMRVRFVRINNKLTKVYENVIEEGLDLYSDGVQAKMYDKEQLNLELQYNEDNSFDFNDSQLVAFPVNAVDPENIINDDSIAMLTPSKLQMLTPSKLEMFTPSKLDTLTTSELDILGEEQYDENADRSFASPGQLTAQPMYTAGHFDEKVETEATIVLKVARSDEIVEHSSSESKPSKKLAEPESPVRDSESRSRNRNSHIRNIWKNIRPQLCQKKRGKQSSDVEVTAETDNEIIEIDVSHNEHSSDEDDLTNYFSKTYNASKNCVSHASKNNVDAQKCSEKPNNAPNRPSCSISVQASFSGSDAESDAEKTKKALSGIKHHSKTGLSNNKRCKQKNRETKCSNAVGNKDKDNLNSSKLKSLEGNILKVKKTSGKMKSFYRGENLKMKDRKTIDSEIKSDNVLSVKSKRSPHNNQTVGRISDKGDEIKNIEDVCSSEEYSPKKKRHQSQIKTFFKDIDYKQVDFTDFEVTETQISEPATVFEENQIPKQINKVRKSAGGGIKKKGKGTSKEIEVTGSKESDENVNNSKEGKTRKGTMKVQVKRKVAKTCLKKEMIAQEAEIKSVDRTCRDELVKNITESDIRSDGKDCNYWNDEQNKIEFLEKLFQIKLKEAAVSTVGKCKNNPQCTLTKHLPGEPNKSSNKQSSDCIKKSSNTKGNAKQSAKMPKMPKTKALKKVEEISDLAIKSTTENLDNKQLSNNKSSARKCKQKQTTDEIADDTNELKNNTSVSFKASKGKKPRKCEIINSDNINETMSLNIHGEKELIGKELENTWQSQSSDLDKQKLLTVKRARGRPRKCITKGTPVNHVEDLTQTVDVINSDPPVKPHSVTKKKSNAKRKEPKQKQLNSDSEKLEMEKLKELCDKPVEKGSVKVKQPKRQKRILDQSRKRKSLNDNVVEYDNHVSTEMPQKESTEFNKKDFKKTVDKNTIVKLQQRRPKSRKPKVEKNRLNTETLKNNRDISQDSELHSVLRENIETSENIYSYDVIPNLAKFQPLNQAGKTVNKDESSKRKKKESVSNSKNVSKRKKLEHVEVQAEVTTAKIKEETLYHASNSDLNEKQMELESNEPSVVNYVYMPLDLSVTKEDQKVTIESFYKEQSLKNSEYPSPRKLRDGKTLKQNSSGKANSSKNLKSTRRPPGNRKLKSKRFGQESWKDKLEDEAFKFDFEDRKFEKHKPVNVRHMIKNILKSVKQKGPDIKKEKKVRPKERKDKCKEERRRQGGRSVISESDDAWLSDSGPSGSFAAFKFSVTSDASENGESDMVDKHLDKRKDESLNGKESTNDSKSDTNERGKGSKLSESRFVKLKATGKTNVLELHHSPHKVSSQQEVKGENIVPIGDSATVLSTEADKSIKVIGHSKESPEMLKNAEKLRALLHKVNEKKVVKQLTFADNVGSSDSEH